MVTPPEVRPNVMQRLDVGAKGIGLFSLLCLAFLFDDPSFNFIILLITAGVAGLAQLSLTKVRQTLLPLVPLFFLIMIFAGFSPGNLYFQREESRTVLFEVWPALHWDITLGGLFRGVTYLLRMLILILSSMIFLQTTSLEKLTQLMQRLKVPSQFSFMIVTAIRFIPVLNRKRIIILEAQKARGAHIPEKGTWVPIQTFLPLIVPMFAGSIQMANTLSMAMMSRGFGYSQYQTPLTTKLEFKIQDTIVIGLGIILVILGLYLRLVLKLGKL